MRLAILVDIIAITARIAIILPTADDQADGSADHRADSCARAGADARKDGTSQRTRACADSRSSSAGGHRMVVLRRGRTTAERQTAHRSSRD